MNQDTLQKQVLEYITQKDYTPQDIIAIQKGLKLDKKYRASLRSVLKKLESKGTLLRLKHSRYEVRRISKDKNQKQITGRIRRFKSGKTLFIPDSSCADSLRSQLRWDDDSPLELLVSPRRMMGCMDGDTVSVHTRLVSATNYRRHHKGKATRGDMRVEVAVEEILQRRHSVWVGIYRDGARHGYVQGDGVHSPQRIELTEAVDGATLIGMSVIVQPQTQPQEGKNATGKVVEVLGWPDDKDVDMQMLIRNHNLKDSFPEAVLEECKSFKERIDPQAYENRLDCRELNVITIDPATARDYDDAISVKRLKAGWELDVHIADVSYYVRPNSALDVEAKSRGNSTYLPDRVLPMLPPILCDNLCSLKEGVDRLTMLCRMQINNQGHITKFNIQPAVICSKKRLAYEEALALIEKSQSTGDQKVDAMIREAYNLSSLMRRNRFAQGSLDLEMPSMQIILDDNAVPIDITIEHGDDAHRLIEEFMLAANECVACTLREKMIPALYRAHEAPNPTRIFEFSQLVRQYGIKCGSINSYEELNWVIEQIKELPDAAALKLSLLRSLTRAHYSHKPLGHFGLAKGDYCHFTSPIRRYADLIVHRSLHRYCGEHDLELPPASQLAQIAEHVSETERSSAGAENEAKKMKLLQYLAKQCELDAAERRPWGAYITASLPKGVTVDVPDLQLKGLISIHDLAKQGRWFFEASVQRWRSQNGECLQVGSHIPVIVHRIDAEKQFVDFIPAPKVKQIKKKI